MEQNDKQTANEDYMDQVDALWKSKEDLIEEQNVAAEGRSSSMVRSSSVLQ